MKTTKALTGEMIQGKKPYRELILSGLFLILSIILIILNFSNKMSLAPLTLQMVMDILNIIIAVIAIAFAVRFYYTQENKKWLSIVIIFIGAFIVVAVLVWIILIYGFANISIG